MIAAPRRGLVVLSLLGLLALEAPAIAAPSAAEALFDRGLAAMEQGHYAAGCADIAESQRLDPRPGTLFTLATCEDQWGHAVKAMGRYGEYLQLVEHLPADRQAAQATRARVARAQRAKLAAGVAELTLTLGAGALAGAVVKRDGEPVDAASLGVAIPVEPGDHVITVEAPGGTITEQRIPLVKGEKKSVTLDAAPARDAIPIHAPAAGGRRTATYVLGGVGVASLVLGGVMGGIALGKKATVDQHCGAAIKSSDETACDPTGVDAVSGGRTYGLVSTVGVVVGLAAVGTAVVLYLTEARPPSPAAASHGRSLVVGLLSAGPAGATVGAQGAW